MSDHPLADHVPAATAVLSAVSLALVFGAVLGALPSALLPVAPDWVLALIPTLNAAICAVAFVVVAVGWRAIRRGDVHRHRRAMLTGLGLFALFLVCYLYRVSLRGPTPFTGPAVVEQYVYLPVLAVHVFLAIVCIPLLYYVVLLALTRPVAALPRTNHPRVGRVAAPLWLVSFGLGVVVYVLLHVAW
ncbi:hypothetical protein GCM10009037_20590 [Halarchaeum grantii]|uniref:DUF420 domain-containing protein n=1 Tax=Halarchaeum grantii TaxID=1193105 RepID=A0A830FDV9_9EURY|nr:DUF420 domain-containing protein [Halarchaeum grantii]GGL36994.1 hypothetical protein GCM10009037_20590 [Halarchaeum grantii]